MNYKDQIANWITETCRLINIENITYLSEENFWLIEVKDNLDIEIYLNDDLEAFTFIATLPTPETEEKSEIYEAALIYNSLWQNPCKAHLALENKNSNLILILHERIYNLDNKKLQKNIEDFIDCADFCKEIITRQTKIELG